MPESESLIDVPYNSYSRLECYTQCSQKYKNRYVDKVLVQKTIKIPLVKGTLFHKCVERYNEQKEPDPTTKPDVFLSCLEEWLLYDLDLKISFNQLCDLSKFARAYGGIITRGSERGKENRILNNDGTVPKSLEDYPPRSFSKAVNDAGLSGGIRFWDSWASNQNDAFWVNSFAFLVSEVYSMFDAFYWADWIGSSVGIEFGLSTNKTNLVKFGDKESFYLRGFIDWIVLTKSSRTCFLDHKTSKTKPTLNEVLHHPQLNLYCQASIELFGEIPDYIGIYHAKSAEYIVSAPDRNIVNNFYDLFKQIQDLVDKEVFIKNHPGLFGSPCKEYNPKNRGYNYCDYIDVCWPSFRASLEVDL